MSDETPALSGPDLTQAIELSTIPDGGMLLGYAQEVAKGRLIPTIIAGLRKRPKASLPTTAGTPA